MEHQHLDNKKGEIQFKEKLYAQQVNGKSVFQDEFDAAGIEDILNNRMSETLKRMRSLKNSGMTLSPYLEIGAERCQRSLILENDLGEAGIAADLSHTMLKSCAHYKTVFGKQKAPLRVCCDITNMPFMSNSLPFVFCYQTLHHFPHPGPVIGEVHRVLSPGGVFFFDEEPYKKILHIDLYKCDKIYSKKTLNRRKLKKVLDYFFCEERGNDTDHGIIENHDLTAAQWREALTPFSRKDVEIRSADFLRASLFHPRSRMKYLCAYLLGGVISGLCRKEGDQTVTATSIQSRYACPSCREEQGTEERLSEDGGSFYCPQCNRTYPIVDGVLFLLSHNSLQALYPDIFAGTQVTL